ncbi:MAG: DNA polymerase III subunit gamma/tau, partial [FCB group bacterium]|nr:DNA polymerase III subunit gamma/tau [FCB group bacterium]
MSYQVLSRKYRPQVFDSIAGQSHVTRTLQNAIRLDRVAHGYLFTGPRGIGKTTVARILAKSLNCKEFHNDEPCDQCVNCVEITEGRSMDVQEIDGASNRGIDEIRDLREAVRYSPSSGKYRIYIIDEVHMLTNPAFNALLKTLEEPPPHVVFIMATTDPHKIPQTILSRTQRFDFKRMRQDEIVDHLGGILQKENIQHSDGSLELIAAKTDGSMRDSLSLLDQVIAYSGDSIEENIVRDVLGIIKESFFLELLQEIHLSNSSALLDHLHHLIESGFSISDFISGFNGFLRNCLLVLSGKKNKTQTTDEVLDWLEQNQTTLSAVDLLRMLEMTLQFESRLRFIQQPRIALESLFLKLAA